MSPVFAEVLKLSEQKLPNLWKHIFILFVPLAKTVNHEMDTAVTDINDSKFTTEQLNDPKMQFELVKNLLKRILPVAQKVYSLSSENPISDFIQLA